MVEINFLCVHIKLRGLRLAPVLIREITRRINLAGIDEAVYTSGVITSMPIATATCQRRIFDSYYHRALNVKKLFDIEFIPLEGTLTKMIKKHKLPKTNKLRLLVKEDWLSACNLLNSYLQKFKLYIQFSLEEFEHWFLSPNVICYVLGDAKVTDLWSFYILPINILNNTKYDNINGVYSFYNVVSTMTLTSLMYDALVIANNKGYDVYNCLNIFDNVFFDDLKIKKGNSSLNYYVKGIHTTTEPDDVGIILYFNKSYL